MNIRNNKKFHVISSILTVAHGKKTKSETF
jgi:hypothetical protein